MKLSHYLRYYERMYGSKLSPEIADKEAKGKECQVSNMSNSTKLVLGGFALMVIGVSAFLHSLGYGGGYGATLTFIAGGVMFMIGCVKYLLGKLHKVP